MSNSPFPSMTALLGLLAVAGYQNRDKIAEMLGGLTQGGGPAPQGGPQPGQADQGGLGGLLGGLLGGGMDGSDRSAGPGATGGHIGQDPGSFLGSGLNEIRERFAQAGQRDTVESWLGTGPNREIAPNELEQAIGPDVLQTLSQRTGLSREELLDRLTRELPNAVDRYTPDGRLPQY
ncbi:YidB family protein [Enterovirga aerilata]|uniref:DUF937 domain-containing protein n=1 Tax=Enterovirga aerilata TaxID=2730920 RepID=A0A849I4B0_9HYPH|nr:YidB family protein [Enterovirga sp. DB1703]NNM72198.1 DUF937 domain-containing protein [Enterovirga sp. DB1703]